MAETDSDQYKHLHELAEEYGQAWNDHDVDAIMSYHTSDPTWNPRFVEVEPFTGSEEVREAIENSFHAMPDQHFEPLEVIAREGLIIVHLLMSATFENPRDLGEAIMEPTGESFEAEIVDILHIEDGKVDVKDSWHESSIHATW
jgi:ketosteroid isomerase-like protein